MRIVDRVKLGLKKNSVPVSNLISDHEIGVE